MEGLIYKDLQLFFRSQWVDKKLLVIAAAAIVLLLTQTGEYGGLLSSIMLGLTVSIQNILIISSDEDVCWPAYLRTLPVSSRQVVGGKYLAVLCTLAVSAAGSVVLSLLSGLFFGGVSLLLLGLSVGCAVAIPLLWTGLCLPITYWFGFRTAQVLGMLLVIPMCCFIKFFEDGPGGLAALPAVLSHGLILTLGGTMLLFALSYGVSVLGFRRMRSR